MIPVRSASGSAVFAMASVEWNLLDPMLGSMSSGHFVTLPPGLPLLVPYLVAGAVIAGAVVALKARTPLPSQATPGPRSRALRSLLGDAAALVGVVVPLLAPVLVVLLLSSRRWVRTPGDGRGGRLRASDG